MMNPAATIVPASGTSTQAGVVQHTTAKGSIANTCNNTVSANQAQSIMITTNTESNPASFTILPSNVTNNTNPNNLVTVPSSALGPGVAAVVPIITPSVIGQQQQAQSVSIPVAVTVGGSTMLKPITVPGASLQQRFPVMSTTVGSVTPVSTVAFIQQHQISVSSVAPASSVSALAASNQMEHLVMSSHAGGGKNVTVLTPTENVHVVSSSSPASSSAPLTSSSTVGASPHFATVSLSGSAGEEANVVHHYHLSANGRQRLTASTPLGTPSVFPVVTPSAHGGSANTPIFIQSSTNNFSQQPATNPIASAALVAPNVAPPPTTTPAGVAAHFAEMAAAGGGGAIDAKSQQQQSVGATVTVTAAAAVAQASNLVATINVSSTTIPSTTSAVHHHHQHHQAAPQSSVATPAAVSSIHHPHKPSIPALSASNATNPTQNFQRLKVEDALSYLDQVKFKFNDQPQVYNDFLDIMKEFKSQSIDTPVVIQRVSTLFRGHSELIVGFNTFLPPGYKIEISNSNEMNVSMPDSNYTVYNMNTGTPQIVHNVAHNNIMPSLTGAVRSIAGATQSSAQALRNTIVTIPAANVNNQPSSTPLLPAAFPPAATSFSNALQQATRDPHPVHVNNNTGGQSRTEAVVNSLSALNAAAGVGQHHSNHRTTVDGKMLISAGGGGAGAGAGATRTSNDHHSSSHHQPSHLAAVHHAQQAQHNDAQRSPPMEFNNAIKYVNKIKSRFMTQPEIYKQFLDILQNYQKEQLSKQLPSSGHKSTESEVYAQVEKLFQNQKDLLEEFSQFLPETNGGESMGTGSGGLHHSGANLLSVPSSHHMFGNSQNSINSMHNTHPQSHIDNVIGASYPNALQASAPNANLNDHGSLSRSKSGNLNSAQINLLNSGGASAHQRTSSVSSSNSHGHHRSQKRSQLNSISITDPRADVYNSTYGQQQGSNKRSKLAPNRDNSFAEACRYTGDLAEYAFFDMIRKTLTPLGAHDDFLRFLYLFNMEILSKSELLLMISPILARFPELFKKIKEMLDNSGLNAGQSNQTGTSSIFGYGHHNKSSSYHPSSLYLEGLGGRITLRDHFSSVPEKENFDVNAGKRYGASYRSVVKPPMECSGRTELCREVLNDSLVSFPSWSEDSTFVSSRKTPYQDQIHQAEDERFELDLVIETNLATIRVLEMVQKKIDRMTSEEKANFKLDDNLGGNSKVLHQLAIRRIYGEKGNDVIDGLKNSPANVIPIVLRRLMAKEEEWREQQKVFNKHWRELNEKCYLKSLDHQAITFKQNDSKYMKPKALLTEIEEEMNRIENASGGANHLNATADGAEPLYETFRRPHMVLVYPNKAMIEVASNLIIHSVKRLTTAHKDDKQKIKQLLRHFIPDLFDSPRGVLSDDDADEEDGTGNVLYRHSHDYRKPKSCSTTANATNKTNGQANVESMLSSKADEEYALFFINENWYYFFRLHYLLCERLAKLAQRAKAIANEEKAEGIDKKHSIAVTLRLKTNLGIDPEHYFDELVKMVTDVLDGNMDANQYEDTLREMFGIHAFIAFTLDKLVQNIARQLHIIVGEDEGTQCIELYLDALKTDGAGGPCLTAHQRLEAEAAYHKNVEQAFVDEDNYFKLIVYKQEGKISIEMLETPEEEDDDESGEADNDQEEDASNQSSRMLRSSAKNNSGGTSGSSVDEAKVIELANERIKASPRFLSREIRRFKQLYSKNKRSQAGSLSSKDKDDEDEEGEDGDDEKLTSSSDEKETKGKTRRRKDQGGNDGDEDEEDDDDLEKCRFSVKNYQRVILVLKDIVMSKDALKVARMNHPRVTQAKYAKFCRWYQSWTNANIASKTIEAFRTWMLLDDTTNVELNKMDTSDSSDWNNNDKTNKAESSTTKKIKEEHKLETGEEDKKKEDAKPTRVINIDASDKKTPYRTYSRYVRNHSGLEDELKRHAEETS